MVIHQSWQRHIHNYMHMEKLMVSSGDRVVAGQLIGAVEAPACQQGPHLHVSLMVHGVQANPLSLLFCQSKSRALILLYKKSYTILTIKIS
jgi:murein DD-endopeptidase MepM/ murein hydrolase activator NlpD